MSQYRLADDGELVEGPVTWDGEPLYSRETVAEGLFDPAAFEGIKGQIAFGPADEGYAGPSFEHVHGDE